MPDTPLGRYVKDLTGTPHEDLSTWPSPDEGALGEPALARYLKRKEGVRMYLSGSPDAAIFETCGLSAKQIYRLIRERCLKIHADQHIYGWRGLVPNIRINPYIRKRPIKLNEYGRGASGAMNHTLLLHPEIKEKFDKRILDFPGKNKLGHLKRPKQSQWKWFLDELRKLGIEARNEWPFNTEDNGYCTVCRYINRVLAENPDKAIKIHGGPELERKVSSGDGVDRPVDRVFQRVEMDAHKLDARMCVMIPQMSGDYVPKIIYRIWVVVIIEVMSRAILSYFLSLSKEISKDDILRAIKNALTKWRRKNLSFSQDGEAYITDAGFPSSHSPILQGACWDETSVDGAMAETCSTVRSTLENVVGSKLLDPKHSFSARRSKDDRPFIESFFNKLSSHGFHRMTITTGGKPKDTQGRDPEKIAIASQFQIEYAQELLDVLIANYNATPHTSLGHRSPLQYLEYLCSRPSAKLRYADPSLVQSLLSIRKKCYVCGGIESSRRPYVNFYNARYSNEILAQRYDLAGKQIWVVNHLEEDARLVQAFTLDGASLGVLRASPPWHKLPHSLQVRNAVNSFIRNKRLRVLAGADAIELFLDYVESFKNSKLPVHPAYLQARQILANHAENQFGKSMLEVALNNQEENTKKKISPQKQNSAEEGTPDSLPTRRQAASK